MPFTLIQSEAMNLADTFAFTGTVSGAGGGKINQCIQAYKTDTTSTTSTSSVSYTHLTLPTTPYV